MKCPTKIHATKNADADAPVPRIARHITFCQSLAVSTSNTIKKEFQKESKFLRSPANPSEPPKSCMPRMVKMNRNRKRTSRKSRIAPTPLATFSISTRIRLNRRRIFRLRSTRKRRSARSAEMPAPAPASSTKPTTTMNASNRLNRSEEYSTTPRPISLRTISSANANVMSVLAVSNREACSGSMPWCSAAIAAVLTRMSRVTNVSNRG